MPPVLTQAHAGLDCAADRFYRKEPFPHDRDRVEHFFALAAPPAPLPPAQKEGSNPRVVRLAPSLGG